MTSLQDTRVLLVGAGGLGCPAATVLARCGVGQITVLDDDLVEPSNLHRQTLFEPTDVGKPKAPLAAERLEMHAHQAGHRLRTEAHRTRLLPENATDLIEAHDLVLEGADNFASKFLVADASALTGRPCVQAGAVRWSGWALGVQPAKTACLRCVFEDIPQGPTASCASAGVVGPVVGLIAGLQARIALSMLHGHCDGAGVLWSYRGLAGRLRPAAVQRQKACPLCAGDIRDVNERRYLPPDCAA